MNTISLVCYILAGIIFLSGLVVFVLGLRKRKRLPKYELDERGIIKWEGKEKDEENPDRLFEIYLLSQILVQISRLPSRGEFYFVVTILVTLLLTIIGILGTIIAMIAGL